MVGTTKLNRPSQKVKKITRKASPTGLAHTPVIPKIVCNPATKPSACIIWILSRIVRAGGLVVVLVAFTVLVVVVVVVLVEAGGRTRCERC